MAADDNSRTRSSEGNPAQLYAVLHAAGFLGNSAHHNYNTSNNNAAQLFANTAQPDDDSDDGDYVEPESVTRNIDGVYECPLQICQAEGENFHVFARRSDLR